MKEYTRLLPVALDRALGDAPETCDFTERESAEVFQVDQLSEPCICRLELVESVTQPLQLGALGHVFRQLRRQGRNLERRPALLGLATARVVDDESAHRAG